MKLTADAVMSIMAECLFRPGEPTDNVVLVEGVIRTFGFHPDRIKENADKIGELLAELPALFQASGDGGGWSFLEACNDKDGHQWGEHRDMEALFALGIAAGKARWLLSREYWKSLPGGMPYVSVN